MNQEKTFTIVFQKLPEATGAQAGEEQSSEAMIAEMDEIDELRRFVLEVTEPAPMSYTIA